MLAPPEGFPKCGNYLPPVGIPPIRTYEKPKSIIPLQNGSNPHHPSYVVPATAKPTKPSKKPGAGRVISGKSSQTCLTHSSKLLISSFILSITWYTYGGISR